MAEKSTSLTDQLREAIAQSGMTQKDICAAAKIDPALMCRFMAGRSGFSVDSLDRLAAALGLSLTRTKRARARKGR
jgi:transcriptional regulator with XRE-family HTH domain